MPLTSQKTSTVLDSDQGGANTVLNSGQGVSSVPLTSQKTSTVLDSDQGGANTVSNSEQGVSTTILDNGQGANSVSNNG